MQNLHKSTTFQSYNFDQRISSIEFTIILDDLNFFIRNCMSDKVIHDVYVFHSTVHHITYIKM